MPNPFRKTTCVEKPYAIYRAGPMEWRILKTYKMPANEAKDAYARWFVAAKSPATYDSWELGDTYAQEVKRYGQLIDCTKEWMEHYCTEEWRKHYG